MFKTKTLQFNILTFQSLMIDALQFHWHPLEAYAVFVQEDVPMVKSAVQRPVLGVLLARLASIFP